MASHHIFTYHDSRHPWRPRRDQLGQEKRQQKFSRSAFIPDLTDPPPPHPGLQRWILEWHLCNQVYSYFEKGCQKKCMWQSQKVLWVVLSSLLFKEIWKNGTWSHEHMFASATGKQHK